MTRLPLATDLKTRIGAPSTKDARQVNSYVEVKGDQTVVRKRPAAQGGIAVGTGTAQGGIGINVNGVPYFFGFWSDVLYPYFSTGTNWNAGTAYLQGAHVSVGFVDYWALSPNINVSPTSVNGSTYWSRSVIQPVYHAAGSHVTYSASFTITSVNNSNPYGIHITTACTIKITGTDSSVMTFAVINGTADQTPDITPTFTGTSCLVESRYTFGANETSGASCGHYTNGAFDGGATNTLVSTPITSSTEYLNAATLAAAMTY